MPPIKLSPSRLFQSKSFNHLTPKHLRTGTTIPSRPLSTSPTHQKAIPMNPSKPIEQMSTHLAPPTPQKQNAWSSPGPAAFDFRSDTITSPTTNMLNAIAATTLLDDVFMEDPTTNGLEALLAEMTGKEGALLVTSGTMGNQVALRSHLGGPPHSVLCDERAHILVWEAGGAASLCGALVRGVMPKNGTYLTLEEVRKHAVLSDDVHACPTKVVSLENTLGGTVMPLEEVEKIGKFARENGILMHLDGARIWEAVVAGAGDLKEYCKHFDSISLCFSKGLGAPIGSIIVGTKPFIKRSRWIRKMIGGGLRQAGVISAAARVAVEETFLGGKLKQSHDNAKTIAKIWTDAGGKLQLPVETNMVWLDVEATGLDVNDFVAMAADRGLRAIGGRLVVHYQISKEAIDRFALLTKDVLVEKKRGVDKGQAGKLKIEIE